MDNQSERLIKMIEDKLNSGLQVIQTNVKSLIDEKLNNPHSHQQNMAESSEAKQTYANAAGSVKSSHPRELRSIMLENKNEELAEETDRKTRAKNIIVHGKLEVEDAEDKDFAEDLLKELQIGAIAINQIERIGQKPETEEGTGKRPIKLTLKSEEDRDKVLDNLRNLKGKSQYKGISVTADYTYSERQLIRDYRDRANLKNDKEEEKSKHVWRVRGTPKNGLSIKRIKKVI